MHPSRAHPKRTMVTLAVTALMLALVACGDDDVAAAPDSDDPAETTVVVGSANFPESILMGNLYAGALSAAGFDVVEQFNIGSREVYFAAMENGELDVLPEYLGSLHNYATGGDDDISETDDLVEDLRAQYEPDILFLEPAEAENANAHLVTQETADEYGLATLSDLGEVAGELIGGGPSEVRDRPDGLPGLAEVYGIEFAEFRDLDACGPITTQALAQGDIDVARACSSMGVIAEEGWINLEDDQNLMNAENLTPVVRAEVHSEALEEALNAVSAALTPEELIELNQRIEIDNDDPDLVAEDWLAEKGLTN